MDTGGNSNPSSGLPRQTGRIPHVTNSPSDISNSGATVRGDTSARGFRHGAPLPLLSLAPVAPAAFLTKTVRLSNLRSPLAVGFSSDEINEEDNSDAATTPPEPVRETDSRGSTGPPSPSKAGSPSGSGSGKLNQSALRSPGGSEPSTPPSPSLRAFAHRNSWRQTTASPEVPERTGTADVDPTRLQAAPQPPLNSDVFLANARVIATAHRLADPGALVDFLNEAAQRSMLQTMVHDMVVDSTPEHCHSDFSSLHYWLVSGKGVPTERDLRGGSRRAATLARAVYGLVNQASNEGPGARGMFEGWKRERMQLMFADLVIAYCEAWFQRGKVEGVVWTNWELVAKMRELDH